jgi:Flp pilus assembly protein TadG
MKAIHNSLVRLRSFTKDRSGSVAVTVALASVVLFVVAGVAVDMARAYRAQHALQINVDQAAIAAAAVAYSESAASNPNDDRMKQVAANYFSANNMLSPNLVLVVEPPQFSYDGGNNDLIVSVPARLETTFLKIVDINEIRFTVSSKVARPQWGPLELALVLDRTWSMDEMLDGQKKYKTLQTAAKSLIDTLAPNPNAAIGIVPFASWLRVDSSYWNQTWLDRPSDIEVAATRRCEPTCVKFKQGPPYNCVKDNIWTTCEGIWECAQVIDKCTTIPGSTYRFDGCFASRPDMPSTIDSPINPKYPGRRVQIDACRQSSILDLTRATNIAELKAKIDSMVPVDHPTVTETYIPGGLEFGWHMLRSGQPLDQATTKLQAQALGLSKVIVLMSDGANTTYARRSASSGGVDFPKFVGGGIEQETLTQARTKADETLKIMCASVKADGITIFTISFAINDLSANQLLKDCASGPSYFFEARSNAALLDAFKRIGAKLIALRIVN